MPLCPSQHYWNWEHQACAECTKCAQRTLAPCRPNADAVCYQDESEAEVERIDEVFDYQSDAPAEGRIINTLRSSRPRTGTFLEELRRKVNQIKPRKKARKGKKGRKGGKKKRGDRKRRRLGGQVERFLRYQQDDPNVMFAVEKRRVEEPAPAPGSWTAGVEAEDDLDGTIKYNEDDETEVARGRNGRRRNDLHSDLQLIERELLLEDLQEEQKAKQNGSEDAPPLPSLPPLEPVAATEKPVIVIGKRRFYATVPSEDGSGDVDGVDDGAESTPTASDAAAAAAGTGTTEATVFGSVISNPHESSRIADGAEDEDELSLLHELLVVDGQDDG